MNRFGIIFLIVFLLKTFQYAYSSDVVLAANRNPHSRISGGNLSSVDQFPWYVFILSQGDGIVSNCGGSILSTTRILTAAHCTHTFRSLDMYFGSNDLYLYDVILTSEHWVEHPDYDPKTSRNDVSVIQLPSPLNFSKSIQPIRLQSSGEANNDFVDKVAIIMGFGQTDDVNTTEPSNLLYTKVKIISNEKCKDSYGADIVTEKTLCAVGYANLKDSVCPGDSGGPMVILDEAGAYTQIGINSFTSKEGCTKGNPSGYVRVSKYLDWIRNVTG